MQIAVCELFDPCSPKKMLFSVPIKLIAYSDALTFHQSSVAFMEFVNLLCVQRESNTLTTLLFSRLNTVSRKFAKIRQ